LEDFDDSEAIDNATNASLLGFADEGCQLAPQRQGGKHKNTHKKKGDVNEYALRRGQLKSQTMLKQSTKTSSFLGKDANIESLVAAANQSTGKRRLEAKNQAFNRSAQQTGGARARDAVSEGGRLLFDLQRSSTGFSNRGIVVDSLIKQYQ